MKQSIHSSFTLFLFVLLSQFSFAQERITLQVPGKDRFAEVNLAGASVLPSGRLVNPVGNVMRITHDPFGLTISPNGKRAVTLHNGVITIIDLELGQSTRVPDYAGKIKSPFPNGSLLGVAFNSDNKTIYLSGGDKGTVIVYNIETLNAVDSIQLDGKVGDVLYQDSFTSDLVYNEQNNELLVLDQANYRMVRIDLSTKKVTASIPVGRLPFGLAISPDKKTAVVANVGMYAYPLVEGMTLANYNSMMISHHPYGHNTPESIHGAVVEGKKIPGLGSPNAVESMSVFTIDLTSNQVTAKLKTGYQVGELIEDAEVIGGASPNSIAIGKDFAYVTNATNDNISMIDYRSGKIIKHIPIHVDSRIDKYRGLLPFGISLSPDESKLYVALLGFNAVAVIDINSTETIGLIPTGWGPTRVKLSPTQNKLYIISSRGIGAGPNGGLGFVEPPQGSYVGDIQMATFQDLNIPDEAQLKSYTKQVIDQTFQEVKVQDTNNPLPSLPGASVSPIKYIVYITKENRTYDEIFGQMQHAKGDSTMARFGMNTTVIVGKDTIRGANITPNHHKVAKKYAFSDNFYCDSDASIHGHHWMMGVIPNEWVEANSKTTKTAKLASPAPGRRFPGSTGSMDPEDYAEIGGLWEALERKGLSFYNFGEANETAHVREEWMDTATGAGHAVMVPMQNAVFTRTSHNYAGFNMDIPDQFRMQQFESEFKKMWLSGKAKMPSLITMQVPNDHTAGPRPADGYYSDHSYVADNDLAVGRIIHFLSRTPYWKNMLVIVTEDDPQGGSDHIDAHRSILMLAGPYVKRGYVSHTHANFGSILKTIYNVLGVPYVNQYDVTASLLQDFFTPKPDFSPYTFEFPDKRIFDTKNAMKRYNRDVDWKAVMKGPEMDDEDDMRKTHYSKKK